MAAATRPPHPSPLVALDQAFVRRVLFIVAVVGLIALTFKLAVVLLMLFASLLIAVLLRTVARLLHDHVRLGPRTAMGVSLVTFFGLIVSGATVLGFEIADQVDKLPTTLPETLVAAEQRVLALPFGAELMDRLRQAAEGAGLSGEVGQTAQTLIDGIKRFLNSAAGAATSAVLVLAGGVYFAINPTTYRNGVLMMIPREQRTRVGDAMDDTARALSRWLLGVGLDMIGVGLITGLGLWAIGLPSPALLGLLAGVGVLVPIIGPTLAAIPGLLLAVAGGPTTVMLTLAVYVVVQQVESNIIMPVVQRHVVALPPLVTLFSVAVFGLMFGVVGVLLAVPLAVAAFVMIRALYVRDILGEDIQPLPIQGKEEPAL